MQVSTYTALDNARSRIRSRRRPMMRTRGERGVESKQELKTTVAREEARDRRIEIVGGRFPRDSARVVDTINH